MNWYQRYANEDFNIDDHAQQFMDDDFQELSDGSPVSSRLWRLKNPLMGLHFLKTIVGSPQGPGSYEGGALPLKLIETPEGKGLIPDESHPMSDGVGALTMNTGNGALDNWRDAHHGCHSTVIKDAIKWLLEHHEAE
jgi:hypothetical protein